MRQRYSTDSGIGVDDGFGADKGAAAPLTLDQKQNKINALVEEVYKEHRLLTPMYPWVLVMVLNKQQVRASGVILAEHQQNKPMHEGVVIATWGEKLVETGHKRGDDGVMVTRTRVLRSELSLGDHVLFHHWAGSPIHGFDDQRFRMVREREWHETQQGGIVGTINYFDAATDPIQTLIDMVITGPSLDTTSLLKARIRDRYVVVDKEQSAVTLSGA